MQDQISLNRLVIKDFPAISVLDTRWQRWKKQMARLCLVDEEHPDVVKYFRSDVTILREKERQWHQFPVTIHPLSKMNTAVEVYSFFFYLMAILMKTLEFGWVILNRGSLEKRNQPHQEMLFFLAFVDVLSWLLMVPRFFVGYCEPKTGAVELRKRAIAKMYWMTGHLVCDVLSSIPRIFVRNSSYFLYFATPFFAFFKLRRLSTFIALIKPTFRTFKITNPTLVFLFGFFFVMSLLTHIMTCAYEGVTRVRRNLMTHNEFEVYRRTHFRNLNFTTRYLVTFFMSSQYTFLVNVQEAIPEKRLPEEVIFSLFNYVTGKLMSVVLWSVLLQVFFAHRMLDIKFQQVLTEMNDYVAAKNIPSKVRGKLNAYYTYKFQKKFFNQAIINSVLSDSLHTEIKVFLCKSLIKRVDIFSTLPSSVVQEVVTYLTPEIYLPNDLIILSGTKGDSLYFIESGTVAVTTPSGKEVAHLQDGAYFGEVCVINKDRLQTATVFAIEYTRVYKLKRRHFRKCMTRDVFQKIVDQANARVQEMQQVEDEYKRQLFQRAYVSMPS